jgi:hypothetical protein
MDQVEEQLTPVQRFFSFAEIVKGRDASVPVTDDGLLHAIPYVSVMTGKNRDDSGKTIRNLSDDLFHSAKFTDRQLSKRGGYPTKLISFENAIELAMVLPGKIAKETRTKFKDIIHRYLAGDHSLISEIRENATSNSPIAQMARASMSGSSLDHIYRKRQLERDDTLFEMEMAERKQRLLQSMAETHAKTVAVQKTLREEYTSLCPGQVLDDRAKLMFKDNLLNLACLPSTTAALVESGVPVSAQEESRPITISSFAAEEGKRYDTKALQRVGAIMSSMYQKKYGGKASQHEQFTDGAVRAVRSYTRKDQDMLRDAFRAFDAQNSMTKS